jgi:integrase
MAVDRKQFINKIDTGLKANKDYKKFYINFKLDSKVKQKVLDFTNKDWDKKTRIAKAKTELLKMKELTSNIGLNINENSTLDQVADAYFGNRAPSNWTDQLKKTYDVHIKSLLGKKKIKDIKKVHLESIVTSMRKKGHTKQTANGCSPRTIKKALSESLRPILQYAVDNDIIPKLAVFPEVKLNRQKKTVTNASETLNILYKTINELYKDNPFYLTLFLFLFFGRRWNEVRTLHWSDINLLNNTYTIRAENNKIGEDQTYDVPPPIKESLSNMLDNQKGLIFKSPVTDKELHPPRAQITKIKKNSGVEKLTLHYFRHILVSALGEMGTAGTILSASLGHTNLSTVDNFYRTANHTKASIEANLSIDKILNSKEV